MAWLRWPLGFVGALTIFAQTALGADPAPSISSFSPASAAVGTSVVIRGSGFLPPLSVTFGGNVRASSLAGSGTQLSVLIPAGAQTGPISVSASGGIATTANSLVITVAHPAFFSGEQTLSSGVYYLQFPSGNPFGYYSYLTDANYIFHFDLGYEYVFNANDGKSGVYFYDFKSGGYFYTNPTFPFPYLYDFSLNSVVYYYPDPGNTGHYNTNGVRYFFVFDTGQITSK